MASVLKLKTDIKKLKAAIASKATSGAIKTKLRGKLTSLENELDKLQPNKRKPKTTGPKNEAALVKLAKKRRTNQGLSTSKNDIERDAIRPAKKAGKRISASGNTYYEYRDNRIDNRQPPKKYRKLADGGYMAKGGKTKDQEVVRGYFEDEAYEYGQGGKVRFNNVSIHISKSTEEDMRNAGFTFDPKGNAPLYYNGKEVGYLSNFNGVMLNDEYVDELVPMFNTFRDAGIWNYRGWKEEAEARKRQYGNKMADGGKTQGYDDKKDESLGMTRGKLSLKDFVGNRKQKEHSRRDDARFEERGKMASGGVTIYKEVDLNRRDGKVKTSQVITLENYREALEKIEELERKNKNPNVKYYTGNIYREKGGYMADGGELAKQVMESDLYEIQATMYELRKKLNEYMYLFNHNSPSYNEIVNVLNSIPLRLDYNKFRAQDLKKDLADGGMMADGGNIYGRQSIKSYYLDTYPTDNIGQEINDEASFEGLNKALDCKLDVYEYLGVGDSLVRERVFGKLSDLMGVSYDVIYDKWLQSDYAKGGYMADGGMVEKLRKEFSTKELDDNLMLDGYKTEVFDYSEEEEAKRWVKKNSKDNYVVPYENDDDNYIYVVVPKHKMADGGSVAKGNYEMLMSQAKEIMHHAEELMQVAKPNMDVEAWVVSKAERATTDLSDITHYLDGLKMAMGGMVKHNTHKVNG